MAYYDKPVKLDSEDQVLIRAEQSIYFQQCCDCGLTHRIEIEGHKGDLWLRHVNIGKQFPDDIVVTNTVREAKKESE